MSTIEKNFDLNHEDPSYAAHDLLCRKQPMQQQNNTVPSKPAEVDDLLRQYYFSAEELRLLSILKGD
jgi:hypothetical protein